MRRELTPDEIDALVEEGYNRTEIEMGFGIFSSDFMNGAEHIERYDEMNIYDGDGFAAEVAESENGIKIIDDIPFDDIPDYEFGYYIDTPENIGIIKNHLLDKYGINWEHKS